MDKETGLVWESRPGETDGVPGITTTDRITWNSARFHCANLTVGDSIKKRKGWRLPSVHELASLLDPTNPGGNPDLPAGAPFVGVQSSRYWSVTTSVDDPTFAWDVFFVNGLVTDNNKTNGSGFVWCVRGGGPLSEY